MPAVIFEDDLIEARIACYCEGQVGFNVRHFIVDSVTDPAADWSNVPDLMSPILEDTFEAVLPENAEYLGVGIRRLNPFPTIEFVPTVYEPVPGTVTGLAMATQVTGLISLYTETPGRRGRGRMYVPFPGEESNDTGSLPTLGYVAALENIVAEFLPFVNLATGGGDLVLRPVLLGEEEGLATIKLITFAVARRRWATQRRRGSYGRPNPRPW